MGCDLPAFSEFARLLAVGGASLAIAVGVGRFAYTPLLPMMRDKGLIAVSDGGVIATIHFVGYWVGALVAARLPFSPLSAMRGALIAIAVATLAMGFVESHAAWAALRWITGFFSAWVLVLVSGYVVRHLSEHAGRRAAEPVVFSGVGIGIFVVGLACLGILALRGQSAEGWQIIGGVALVGAIFLCISFGPELPAARTRLAATKSARRPISWPMVIAYGTAGLGYIVPATYLPVMAQDVSSSSFVFVWVWIIFGVTTALSTLFSFYLRRRYSDSAIWVASQIIMAVGVLIPAIHPHTTGMAVSGLCVGSTFIVITIAGVQEAHRIAPRADVIRHIAIMTSAFATGQIIGPVLASSIYAYAGNFNLVLFGIATALSLSAAGLIYAPSPKERPIDEPLP